MCMGIYKNDIRSFFLLFFCFFFSFLFSFVACLINASRRRRPHILHPFVPAPLWVAWMGIRRAQSEPWRKWKRVLISSFFPFARSMIVMHRVYRIREHGVFFSFSNLSHLCFFCSMIEAMLHGFLPLDGILESDKSKLI